MTKKKSDNEKASIHKLHTLPDDLREIWDLAEPHADSKQVISEEETEEALNNVFDTLGISEENTGSRNLYRWFVAAAVLLITVSVGYLNFYSIQYTAPSGGQLSVVLDDGSTVQLNGNSTISHSPLFGITNRDLELNGEAYFEVSHSTTPFIVTTASTQTTVHGTKFNIIDWGMETLIEPVVTVTEGKVSVTDKSNQEIFLTKNQQARLNTQNSELVQEPITSENVTISWLNGELEFQNITLPEFFERLELHFGQEITLEGDLNDEKIKAIYKNTKSLDEILSDVAIVKGLTVEMNNDGYLIKK